LSQGPCSLPSRDLALCLPWSEIFCRALSTASKTVFVVAAVCVRINSDTDEVNFVTSSRSAARSAVNSWEASSTGLMLGISVLRF
jgi:hypothetical protein